MNIKRSKLLPDSAHLAVTELNFINSKYDQELWKKHLAPLIRQLEQVYTPEEIRNDQRIAATRSAYKGLELDPSRYRPSSEALLRRVSKGQGIYHINTLVDLNNYLSLMLRLPIGSYDMNQLNDEITYGIGRQGDSYQGIGKAITISNFPILLDSVGPFGSPIADSARTLISLDTTHALLVVYCFGQGTNELQEIQQQIKGTIEATMSNAEIMEQTII